MLKISETILIDIYLQTRNKIGECSILKTNIDFFFNKNEF